MRWCFLAAMALSLAITTKESVAQSDLSEATARQAALYQQLLDDPNNLDLMFAYAAVSMRLEDLEAAIATLERMLILKPDLPRVQLELGAAYFRLGAYSVAQFWFNKAKQSGNPPPEVLRQVAAFEAQIQERTSTSSLFAEASVGVTYSTNANLGPDSANVQALGFPATLAPQFVSNDDFGFRALGTLTHTIDLSPVNTDVWRTDATVFTVKYIEEGRGNVDVFSVATGPQLGLDQDQFGVKIRPLATLEHVRSDDQSLYWAYGGGVELSDTVNAQTAVFGSVRGGYRDYANGNGAFEGGFVDAAVGYTHQPSANFLLRASLRASRDDANQARFSNTEFGVRTSVSYTYDSGFGFSDRKWLASFWGQVDWRYYDTADPSVNPRVERQDVDFRFGLSNRAYLEEGFFLQVSLDYLYRDSNLPNFGLTNLSSTFSVGRRF